MGSGKKEHKKSVYASGGVVWRHDRHGVRVALIHRPRYDDWTLPKGKTDSDETFVATAIREIGEETGFTVRLGRRLAHVRYSVDQTTTKHVHYWSAQYVTGDFTANDEVDDVEWLDVDAAGRRLSYRIDRGVLAEFSRLPTDLKTMIIVRHGKAGQKTRFRGDDRLRPLDEVGRRQAIALVGQCLAYGADNVHAADRLRCEQTVAPLAAELGVSTVSEPTLSEEAYRESPQAARSRIRDIAATPGTHVVCSQGKVIPPLLQWWAGRDRVAVPQRSNRKGSMWVISMNSEQRMVDLDYIDRPLRPR